MRILGWWLTAALILFTLRRYIYWFASCLPAKPLAPSRTKSIAVLVAARNEQELLPRLLRAIDSSDYPCSLLSFVLVNDASTDTTGKLIQEWCSGRDRAQSLHLPLRLGKAAALTAALRIAPESDIVAVLDADTEPAPDALAWLAGAFEDGAVGAACGYAEPGNGKTSLTSRYAALERWVYHLVVLAGKDRLGLNPPAIGALSAFRRDALDSVGGFPGSALAEDVCVSMELVSKGWRTRWVREAVTREDVPEAFGNYRDQRIRWSRGLLESRRFAGGLEDILVALGYFDRLVFASALAMFAAGKISFVVPAIYLMAPGVMILTALKRARSTGKLSYLVAAPPMLMADIAVTIASGFVHLTRRRVSWDTRRVPAMSDSKVQ